MVWILYQVPTFDSYESPALSVPGFFMNDYLGARRCKRDGVEIMDTVEDGVGGEVW